MLTATPQAISYSAPFLPRRPSPLSPRSTNVLPPVSFNGFFGTMSTSENTETPKSAYSHRTYKPTPFTNRNRDEQRETRRHLFLKRVEQTRDDKKWTNRSEELDRSDYFAERRKWEEDMARRAQQETLFEVDLASDIENQFLAEQNALLAEETDMSMEMTQEPTVEEIDDSWVITLDDGELIPEEEMQQPPSEPHDDASSTTSWDDDEYENLFLEFISDGTVIPRSSSNTDQFMDMSTG